MLLVTGIKKPSVPRGAELTESLVPALPDEDRFVASTTRFQIKPVC